MATSGSTNFNTTASDIITVALQKCGVLGEGETASTEQTTSTLLNLNMLIKTWQADGLNLFTVQEAFVFPKKTQKKYTLAAGTSDHYVNSFGETTVAVAASSGASTVTVLDATSISDGDYIGVEVENGVVDWDTVNGNPVGNIITLTGTLSAPAALDAKVFFYTTRAVRPLKVLEAYVATNSSSSEVPIDVVSRTTYDTLSNKEASGVINQVYFDPQVGTSALSVWPTAADETQYVKLKVKRPIEDFDATSDDCDLPQEWYLPLALNLAVLIAPDYGVPAEDFKKIGTLADYYYEMVSGFDQETETSIQFSPDFRYGGY